MPQIKKRMGIECVEYVRTKDFIKERANVKMMLLSLAKFQIYFTESVSGIQSAEPQNESVDS